MTRISELDGEQVVEALRRCGNSRTLGVLPLCLTRGTAWRLSRRYPAQVAGGYCHALFRAADGRVLSTGAGDDGQRGDGLSEDWPVVGEVLLPVEAGRCVLH